MEERQVSCSNKDSYAPLLYSSVYVAKGGHENYTGMGNRGGGSKGHLVRSRVVSQPALV